MDGSKKCFKCGAIKPLTEFYKHGRMLDGHLNKCKCCTKADAAKHRADNLDAVRAYDRRRAKLPARAAAKAKQVQQWYEADARRMRAHNAVARALRAGRLAPLDCERCGRQDSHAHHDSYDAPLRVTWLCPPCHKTRHKELKKAGIEP